jgi:hypothetical protein
LLTPRTVSRINCVPEWALLSARVRVRCVAISALVQKQLRAIEESKSRRTHDVMSETTYSWGSAIDDVGRPIDADATVVLMPSTATDADIALLAQTCKKLETLHMYDCKSLTDACLPHLAAFGQTLTWLVLNGSSGITDAGLAHLASLPLLGTLNLDRCSQITDAGMANVSRLQQLHGLGISKLPLLSDAALRYVAELKQLKTLYMGPTSVGGCRITDAGLQCLGGLQRLEFLNLSGIPGITDAGLQSLAGLQQLQTLDLGGCAKITDAGLLSLAGLQLLEDLTVDDTAVTEGGEAAFRDAQRKAASAAAAPAADAAIAADGEQPAAK